MSATPVPTANTSRRHRSQPRLAREGWAHVAIVLVLTLAVQYYAGLAWAAPLWLLTLFVVQFFRDPVRYIPMTQGGVICPADGRVIAVGEVEDPYLKRPAVRISIFMNVFNVHSNRIPVSGLVQERRYAPGQFVNAALDKASEHNERNALWIKVDGGFDVVVVQVAGLIARRILCYVEPGEHVERGERYGFIRFGSRVDLYLPVGTKLNVALGDKVKSGNDIVAYLPQS